MVDMRRGFEAGLVDWGLRGVDLLETSVVVA